MIIQRIIVALLLIISAESYCQEFSTLGEIYNFEVGDEFQILLSEIKFIQDDTVYSLEKVIINQKQVELD